MSKPLQTTTNGAPERRAESRPDKPPAWRQGAEGSWKAFLSDIERHGGELRNSAIWHMGLYRFGNWSLSRKSKSARWLTSKIYGTLYPVIQIVTGVSMDRQTRIGEDFHLVHTDAPISIHPDVVIGDRVGIMHGVTIGSHTTDGGGVPKIGNDVFIGTGAVVLGDITVGDNVSIAANSLVTTKVPSNSVAVGVPAKIYPKLKLR